MLNHGLHTAIAVFLLISGCQTSEPPRVLVFSKTEAYRHESISAAHAMFRRLESSNAFAVDSTEDAALFKKEVLEGYKTVVFLLTTGDVLDDNQQAAFEEYVGSGGGYVGIHSASDTEYDWPWYGELVGGYFDGHPSDPGVRTGTVWVEDSYHVSTNHLPERWVRDDEWYDIRDYNPATNVLLSVEEASYRDTVGQATHPLAWYHAYGGGRAFYTALGHTPESYSEEAFVHHVLGGVKYALGVGDRLPGPPPESSFIKEVLLDSLYEPMELDAMPDGRLLYIQRRGEILIVDADSMRVDTAAVIEVDASAEDGLLGLAMDPSFSSNHWIYLFYSVPGSSEQSISRFSLVDDRLDKGSEQRLLSIPLERGCCHSGGSLEFDPDGNLFISVGDNTNPFESGGRTPIDEREGREHWNAQRSAANANDLRGKILRIHPEPDGSYSIPAGNLFPSDGSEGRPEIYIMGDRNPFRISIDSKTRFLYWGEVGPDAQEDHALRGPRGYDEINQARAPGNFGWPYFIADNRPYAMFDFEHDQVGDWFDPAAPINRSRLNTGPEALPAAKPAMIWYPYDESKEFPQVGAGGRSSMAGPVFYSSEFESAAYSFPHFYDGQLFIYDWMRNWIKAVTLDESGNLLRIEDFLPSIEFSRPTDMVFADDGSLYLLEYGEKWYAANPDARLSRIRYNPD